MERLIRVKETQADLLLSGFRFLYADFLRDDLEPRHREYLNETLNEIARKCVDQGLGHNLAVIQHDMQVEKKLTALRDAVRDGAIEQ